MDNFQALILALIQGLTEFLPISSSAHLILPAQMFGWPDQGLAFDVAVHLGTLLAVVAYYRRDLWAMTRGAGDGVVQRRMNPDLRLGLLVVLATVPAVAAGFLAKDLIENELRSAAVIAVTTVVFGGVSSPLVWGRAGAMLMRSGQSLFEAMELLIQCYVDDPLLVIRGPAARRRHLAAILITWWRALGPSLSWSKMGKGTRVIWIGAALEVLDRYVVKAELPKPFVDEHKAELKELAEKDVVKLSLLRRAAGRGSWATGMAPAVRNFLQPFWATIADVARADLQRGGQRMRWRGEPMVHTTRVRSAVVWLLAFLSGAAGAAALQRTLDWRVALAPITLLVTADASPWGLGAILSLLDGTIVAWLASDVTELDCQVLKITFGDCSGQAVVEALALLVALRVWAPRWTGQRVRAHIRSDSVAALGALRKLASPAPSLNAVAREAALDIAASTYGVELTSYAHISGALNDWADALSRLSAPVPRSVPLALDEALRTEVPRRGAAWWRARVESSREHPRARVRAARLHMKGS